jgi:hypothetical protein
MTSIDRRGSSCLAKGLAKSGYAEYLERIPHEQADV